MTRTAARLSMCTQLQEHVCPISGAGHEISFVDDTATATQEGDSRASCCLLPHIYKRWTQDTTLYICTLGTAGDRGKYNLNVQEQHPKWSYLSKLSPSCACVITWFPVMHFPTVTACLLVNGTEIITLIIIHTPHISILTLLWILLWYKYAYSNVALVNSNHFPPQVNECKALIQY